MISFSDAWLNLVNVVKSFRPTDVLDILITSFLVYKLITWAKVTGTNGNLHRWWTAAGAGDCLFFSRLDAAANHEIRHAVFIQQRFDFAGGYFSAGTAYGAGTSWPQPDFQTGIVFPSGGKIGGSAMENSNRGDL